MKPRDPRLLNLLAAEYALGTLRGAARRRCERWLRDDARFRAEVRRWEAQLAALAGYLPPVAPAPSVWVALERRVAQDQVVPARAAEPRPAPLWRVWAGIAAAAAIVALVLFTQYRVAPPQSPPSPAAPGGQYVALLRLPNSNMQWTLSLSPARGEMRCTASGEYPQLGAHSLELWWLSPQGPVSLGLLPSTGEHRMPLPKAMAGGGKIVLAISMEPPGGSPSGKPTGPVLTSAPVVLGG